MHHNFVKKSSLMLLGMGGEVINSQILSTDMKVSQNKMKTLPNINNSKDYCPYFQFFLDAVNQLIKMNASQFEFTSSYLSHLAFNCFTNKFFETLTPIIATNQVTDRLFLNEKVRLISLLQPSLDSKNNVYLNQTYSKFADSRTKVPMELDRTKIGVWTEYFCRYDESKYWQMTQQLQMGEEQLMSTASVQSHQKQLDYEIEALLTQLSANNKRIQAIRNLAQNSDQDDENDNGDDEIEEDDQNKNDFVEVAKNGSIMLNREDLQIVQLVEQKLSYKDSM